MKPIYARIIRSAPVASGATHYEAVTTRGKKQTIYLRGEIGMARLADGAHVIVRERHGEWSLA